MTSRWCCWRSSFQGPAVEK